MEEAESKAQALERVADLEDELGRANERLQELEVSVHVFKCLIGIGKGSGSFKVTKLCDCNPAFLGK